MILDCLIIYTIEYTLGVWGREPLNMSFLPKCLEDNEKVAIFAAENIKKEVIMAKPIEPTPVLKGDDAFEFVAEMEKQKKASAEEKARVAKGASFIQSLLTFTF